MTPSEVLADLRARVNSDDLLLGLLVVLGLVVLLSVIAVPIIVSNRRRKQREARFDQLKQDAHEFFQGIERTGRLSPPDTNVITQKGEVALRDEASVLYETRAYRVSGGAGTRIGRIYVGGGVSESHQRWRRIDTGRLTLTSKRLIFDGSQENRAVRLADIVSVQNWSDAIEVSTQRRAKSLVFQVENPLIWSTLVQQVASGNYLPSPP
jgi:type II secretory pathway pseudopilin PulG